MCCHRTFGTFRRLHSPRKSDWTSERKSPLAAPAIRESLNDFVGPQIEHFERIVTQSAHEQALTLQVHVKMIDASMHIRQQTGVEQTKRCFLLRARDWNTERQHENEDANSSDHRSPSRQLNSGCLQLFKPASAYATDGLVRRGEAKLIFHVLVPDVESTLACAHDANFLFGLFIWKGSSGCVG